jgi:hypothetical protein
MAVDLAAATREGFDWEMAQIIATLALSYYVQSTEELQVLWDQLPPEKRTAQRHEK